MTQWGQVVVKRSAGATAIEPVLNSLFTLLYSTSRIDGNDTSSLVWQAEAY